MSKIFINHIGTYNDNHKELTINGANNVSDVVRAFMSDSAEDIQPEELKPEPKPQGTDLPFLNLKKLEELGLYTLEQFSEKYRQAVESDAKTLADFLKKYRDLEVFDFQGRNKKEIFAALQDYFPTMRQYTYRNFTDNF